MTSLLNDIIVVFTHSLDSETTLLPVRLPRIRGPADRQVPRQKSDCTRKKMSRERKRKRERYIFLGESYTVSVGANAISRTHVQQR